MNYNFTKNIYTTDAVTSLIFSNEFLISSSHLSNKIKVWDVQNAKLVRNLNGHTSIVTCLVMCEDNILASSSGDGIIKIWDIHTGQILHTFVGHNNSIKSLSYKNGILASISYRMIKLWDVSSGTCKKTITIPFSDKTILFISDTLLASANDYQTIHIWNIETNTCILSINAHEKTIIDMSSYEHLFASGGIDGLVKIWDIETKKCIQTLSNIYHPMFKDATYLIGEDYIDKKIKMYDINTGIIVKEIIEYKNSIMCIAYANNMVACGSIDGTIKITRI
jgi:WD40 repeat protein